MPVSPRAGDQVVCEWQLTNHSDTAIVAGFYLRTSRAPLAALGCSSGQIRGRFYGSAVLEIPRGKTATISALLEPRVPGEHQLRVTVVTRNETLERADTIRVMSDE
jgi:hypothetical protein